MCSACSSENAHYRAPMIFHDVEVTCVICGERILPLELIADIDGDTFAHEDCIKERNHPEE